VSIGDLHRHRPGPIGAVVVDDDHLVRAGQAGVEHRRDLPDEISDIA